MPNYLEELTVSSSEITAQIAAALAAEGNLGNKTFPATLGPELAPALITGNWTLGTGWSYLTTPDRLTKAIDGTGNATPSAATSIIIGVTYKVVIVVDSISGTGATYSIGGGYGTTITIAGTYTDYITALSTDKLIIYPVDTSLRITISSISIKALTAGEGDVTVYGNMKIASPIQNILGQDVLYIGTNKMVGIGKQPSSPLDITKTWDPQVEGSKPTVCINTTISGSEPLASRIIWGLNTNVGAGGTTNYANLAMYGASFSVMHSGTGTIPSMIGLSASVMAMGSTGAIKALTCGNFISSYIANGTTSYMYGNSSTLSVIGYLTYSPTITNAAGYNSIIVVQNMGAEGSTSKITNAYGFKTDTMISATQALRTSQIDNLYGLHIKTPVKSGAGTNTILNHWGIYIENINQASTLNYAIYTNLGLVHIGDSIDIASGKNLTLLAGNIITDITTGTKIGTAVGQKLGFWNATPVVQQAHVPDASSTLDSAISTINTVISRLETLGLLAAA